MSCKNIGHEPFDIESYHFLSVISKGVAHVVGQVDNLPSFLHQINVNRSVFRTEYVSLIFLINSLFQQLLAADLLNLGFFGLVYLKVPVENKNDQIQSSVFSVVHYDIVNLLLEKLFLLEDDSGFCLY